MLAPLVAVPYALADARPRRPRHAPAAALVAGAFRLAFAAHHLTYLDWSGDRHHVGQEVGHARLQCRSAMSAAIDFDTTLIRSGIQATTISELSRFVSSIETRPLDRLLNDLPGSRASRTPSSTSPAPCSAAAPASSTPVEREQLRIHAEEVAADRGGRARVGVRCASVDE